MGIPEDILDGLSEDEWLQTHEAPSEEPHTVVLTISPKGQQGSLLGFHININPVQEIPYGAASMAGIFQTPTQGAFTAVQANNWAYYSATSGNGIGIGHPQWFPTPIVTYSAGDYDALYICTGSVG